MKMADLEILSDFTNETLEGQLANQELRTLLVFSDLTGKHTTKYQNQETEK